MSIKGILVDYYYCSGCHTCEIACAVSHELPNDQAGVVLTHVGPWEASDGTWVEDYIPHFTNNCNLCQNGESAHDGMPMCAHHCQSQCITFGDIAKLSEELAKKPNQVLFALDY